MMKICTSSISLMISLRHNKLCLPVALKIPLWKVLKKMSKLLHRHCMQPKLPNNKEMELLLETKVNHFV